MKPWKIALIVVLTVVAFAGSIVLLVFHLTGGVADGGTAFLRAIATDGPAAAYDTASPAFQAQTSAAAFTRLAVRLHLNDFADASWSSRQISGSVGTIGGTITLKSGTTLPVEMTLVKQGDVWKVTGFTVPGGLSVGGGENRTKN